MEAILYSAAGLIVLMEALNKLERTAPLHICGLSTRERAVLWLKATAWLLLTFGGGGALMTLVLDGNDPTAREMCMTLGFACLVLRSRIRELIPGESRIEPEDFERTRAVRTNLRDAP